MSPSDNGGDSREWPATAELALRRAQVEAGLPPNPAPWVGRGGSAAWAEAHLQVCQDDHPRILVIALLLLILGVHTVPLGLVFCVIIKKVGSGDGPEHRGREPARLCPLSADLSRPQLSCL